mgnify:CR=1 FL=1
MTDLISKPMIIIHLIFHSVTLDNTRSISLQIRGGKRFYFYSTQHEKDKYFL